jgi:beta-galactosidase/beta-glucuronidase
VAVPGNVHLELLRAGLIEDPRVGVGVLTSRWVETCRWSYATSFQAPGDVLAGATRRIWLVFDRILGAARIELNGETVGSHFSAVRPCRVDVTGCLRPDGNVLRVEIEPVSPADVTRLSMPRHRGGNDWSPRLIPVGLAGGARVEWTHLPVRVDGLVAGATLAENLSSGRVHVRQFVEVLTEQPARVTLLAQLPEAGALVEVQAELPPGPGVIEATLDVQSPRAWFPAGLGAQNLYTLMTTVVANGHDAGRQTTAVGFRHVQIDEGGQALARVGAGDSALAPATPFPFVRVNGLRLFGKAATVLPGDLLEDSPAERLNALLGAAAEVGINALVVPTDAGPAPAALYELADRAGVVVFQELRTGDDVEPTVRGLEAHPSLLAWCGPELDGSVWPDDRWRPVIGWIEARSLAAESAMPDVGRNGHSSERVSALAGALHDCAGDGGASPSAIGGSRDCRDAVAHGEALSAVIESARRQVPHVAGVHLHRLNDCWPATRTRALVDHAGRRMPAWYYARRALAPIHVTLAVEGEEVVVFGLNDTAKPGLGDLRFGVVQLDGMFVVNRSVRVQLNPRTCTRLVTFPLARWRDRHQSIAFALLSKMNRLMARNCLAITPPDQLRWAPPAVQTQLIAQQVTFTSPTFARGVCLDDSGEQVLADNYFDLYPGIPHTIAWKGPHVPRIVHVANG